MIPAQQPTDHQHELPASVIKRSSQAADSVLAGVLTTDPKAGAR